MKWRPTSTLDHLLVVVSIHTVLTAPTYNTSFSIPIEMIGENKHEQNVETTALLDTGAGGKFINQNYVQKMGFFPTCNLEKSVRVWNIDGILNKKGTIMKYVLAKVKINGKT